MDFLDRARLLGAVIQLLTRRTWKMIGNPKYGLPGVIGMPYLLLFEVLGPVIEISGYFMVTISYVMGWINITFLVLFLSLAILLGVLLSLFSLLLEEYTVKKYQKPWDVVKLLVLRVLENFGYRQLHSWWRLKAIFDVICKKRAWGEMQRKGFV